MLNVHLDLNTLEFSAVNRSGYNGSEQDFRLAVANLRKFQKFQKFAPVFTHYIQVNLYTIKNYLLTTTCIPYRCFHVCWSITGEMLHNHIIHNYSSFIAVLFNLKKKLFDLRPVT